MHFGTYERNAVMSFKERPHRRYHVDGTVPDEGEIFVFGSNESGRHGAGAALLARTAFGAVYGQGRGLQGQAYAVPTKTGRLIVRELEDIAKDVRDFVHFTLDRPDLAFFVTGVGTGLAGYSARDIAPMFRLAINCSFPQEWKPYLEQHQENNNENGDWL
jgi:hypothetical protein